MRASAVVKRQLTVEVGPKNETRSLRISEERARHLRLSIAASVKNLCIKLNLYQLETGACRKSTPVK